MTIIHFLNVYHSRREEIRRQRIESEQRRRDELRDGYRRLKDVLPVSNQKSSKVSLLDRGKLVTTATSTRGLPTLPSLCSNNSYTDPGDGPLAHDHENQRARDGNSS